MRRRQKTFAFCFRSGQIRIGRRVPAGAIQFASGDETRLRAAIEPIARLAYDGKTLLVPGLPEAKKMSQALLALGRFERQVKQRLERRT